jgi:hypothetical protein
MRDIRSALIQLSMDVRASVMSFLLCRGCQDKHRDSYSLMLNDPFTVVGIIGAALLGRYEICCILVSCFGSCHQPKLRLTGAAHD